MYSFAIIAPVILIILFSLVTGQIGVKRRRRIKRSESPFLYWLLLVAMASLAACLFMVFREVDASNAETRRKVKEFSQNRIEKSKEEQISEIREEQAKNGEGKAIANPNDQ